MIPVEPFGSAQSPAVVWVQWFFGKGCCWVLRAEVVVEGVEPVLPKTSSDWAWGQCGAALAARTQLKEAGLVAWEPHMFQLWEDEKKQKLDQQNKKKKLCFCDLHLMSLTTSWWDMEDTSEPLTWQMERRRLKQILKQIQNLLKKIPLWFCPLPGPLPWLLHHLKEPKHNSESSK